MPSEAAIAQSDLVAIPFLAGLSNAEIQALRQACEPCAVREGELVFEQGDVGTELFVILEGEIAVERSEGATLPRCVAILGAGAVVGEIGFLLGTSRTASARATRPTRLARFSREALAALEGPGRRGAEIVQAAVARLLAMRLARMNDEMDRVHVRLSETLTETSRALREWTAQQAAASHLAGELRDLAELSGQRVERMTALLREADARRQQALYGWGE